MVYWNVVDNEDDMNVIRSKWDFMLKQYPDGLIKKFKARLCTRGDMKNEGIYFFNTYEPVFQWTTTFLMLIIEVILQLK